MIDPSIITRGAELAQLQQQQNMEALGNLGGNLGKMVLGRRINQMRQLDSDNERKAFANDSIFAPYLNETLRGDQAAAQKAMYDQMKAEADIAKTSSEAYKNNQQGSGYGLDNSGKKLGAIQGAFQQASLTGDKVQVMLALDGLKRTGYFPDEADYQHQVAIVKAMTPDEIKQYAGGINFANAKDPASLQYADANTVANNAQSDRNSQRTYEASIYSTDVGADTADKNRVQQQSQFDANLYVQQNKPLDYFTAADGTRYAVYANSKGIPISSAQGVPLKAQPQGGIGTTTQNAQREETQRLQRVDAILPEIEKILPNATSSYVGAGADLLGRAVGYSTDGAKATAQLKTLAGQLVSLMPKMSGPQSDKDVAMYREMAGNLADDTQPIQTRMAALQTIKALNNKYKGMNQQSVANVTPSTFNLFD
ncbi:hypothetical protein [Acinetobacter junii]|uniref:hypothetical protein n=1 Tax=Acinetobacter junii TaxID=40215 RepID=UPI00124E12E7|nr:hypothetical protein [Acinetobacter junii]